MRPLPTRDQYTSIWNGQLPRKQLTYIYIPRGTMNTKNQRLLDIYLYISNQITFFSDQVCSYSCALNWNYNYIPTLAATYLRAKYFEGLPDSRPVTIIWVHDADFWNTWT
jgi:hypothetical protein